MKITNQQARELLELKGLKPYMLNSDPLSYPCYMIDGEISLSSVPIVGHHKTLKELLEKSYKEVIPIIALWNNNKFSVIQFKA